MGVECYTRECSRARQKRCPFRVSLRQKSRGGEASISLCSSEELVSTQSQEDQANRLKDVTTGLRGETDMTLYSLRWAVTMSTNT